MPESPSSKMVGGNRVSDVDSLSTRLQPEACSKNLKGRIVSQSQSPRKGRGLLCFSNLVTLCLVLLSFSLSSTFAAKPKSSSSSKGEKRVVCYYTNWSAYRQGPAKFLPDNINPYLCTHLVYAFGGLTTDSGIKPFDKYQDIDKGGYTKFNGLKTYNKALKTLVAIGGWNEGSRRFSNLVADAESRKTFTKYAIRFLRQYQFDGLDLDWEYPASREGGVPEDKKNYAVFIKELREAFEEESKSTGRARLLLTVAVPAGIEWIQKGFDIPTINRNIDFFNLLTYDYHASTEPNANHHAPLKARDGISDYDWKGQLNIEYTINHYLKEGADPDKLVVGLPTYGRSYNLFNVDSYGIDAPSSGPGTKGKYTKEPGYLAYYEICEGVKSGEWRVENAESETQGPHAVKHDQWVGYDDTRMMAIKGKWVKENGLGGIMFWSVDNDDFRGACHGKPFPLIEAAKLAYITGDAPTSSSNRQSSKTNRPSLNKNNRFASSNRRVTTPAPPKTTTGAPTKPRRNKNRRNKKKNKVTTTTTTTSTTTTPEPTTFNPLNTPAPPTTPDPGVDFECKDDGFFPHPRECKKYFWCLEAPGLGLVAHHFTCPAGLFFNKNTDSCDYARNVACKDKNAASKTSTTAAPTTTTSTTTTPKPTTTTTTTTEAPEEEEYDDEEYEDEEEPEEKPSQQRTKPADNNNGRSVKEINDIKDLLKLIRKLGGVEELEKYLDENPSVAAAIEDYEDDEVEEKPKTATTSSLFKRNRFTPTSTSGSTNTRTRFGTSSNNNPVASSSLKYTSIQRNRPSTTSTTASPEASPESEEEEEVVTTPKKKLSFVSQSRPKYVTLSRNSKQTDSPSSSSTTAPDKKDTDTDTDDSGSEIVTSTSTSTEKSGSKAPPSTSSTETSVVVRYSQDDKKILDEISKDKPNADKKTERGDNSTDSDEGDADADADDNTDGYIQLTRRSSTTTAKPKPEKKAEEASEEENSDEYESEEDPVEEQSIVELSSLKPSTTVKITSSTSTTESPAPTTKPKLRIPTRKTNGFASRTRGTTTTTTTQKPTESTTVADDGNNRKARNFPVGNRRSLFQNRNKSVPDAASSQTANEESIAELDLATGSEISRRVDNDETTRNEIPTLRSPKTRSRSIASSSYSKVSTTTASSNSNALSNSRSRSRFRSTTEKAPPSTQEGPSTRNPIVFRRRIKGKTATTSTSTTTTTTTTTKRPTTLKTTTPKDDEEDAEYYYYYYDDDDDLPPTHQLVHVPTRTPATDIFRKAETLRTTTAGLRTETFSPSTSTVQLHKQQHLVGGDRGFAKRNLETQQPPQVKKPKAIANTDTKLNFNTNSFNPGLSHKWSDRAVVPLSEKIKLRSDGTVECLDKGIFPHPISCKQFVHCVPSELNNGSVRAWVYSCPSLLTFDPVGGMCNYDEFAHSKKTALGSACIE